MDVEEFCPRNSPLPPFQTIENTPHGIDVGGIPIDGGKPLDEGLRRVSPRRLGNILVRGIFRVDGLISLVGVSAGGAGTLEEVSCAGALVACCCAAAWIVDIGKQTRAAIPARWVPIKWPDKRTMCSSLLRVRVSKAMSLACNRVSELDMLSESS